MEHKLPELPFTREALAPYLSPETLEYHHGKHHRAYVDNLNKLIAGTEYENLSLEDIVARSSGGIFNNGAQAWNHSFYWNCLSPSSGGLSGVLLKETESNFGSYQLFKEQFTKAAAGLFGSGWAWLVQGSDGKLAIETTSNAGNPLREGHKPLLVCDVWEHAYYIDYRNARMKYIEAFFELINWEFVASNLGR